MAVAQGARPSVSMGDRLLRTVELLERRGYAVPAGRLAAICVGGPVDEPALRELVGIRHRLREIEGVVVPTGTTLSARAISARARQHELAAARYLPPTLRFVHALVAAAPFVISVAIAGSLASGGFTDSDDVDLNLVVEDGYRHQAYVALNLLALLHALRHRGKPVDDLTRRPLAPRLMTANLILERSDWSPLVRQDADMAYELLAQEPVFGEDFLLDAVGRNPGLLEHFPQLASRRGRWQVEAGRRAPGWLFPRRLEPAARRLGGAGWRYMMWTRRNRPEALRRVELVRRTMRPYALFDS